MLIDGGRCGQTCESDADCEKHGSFTCHGAAVRCLAKNGSKVCASGDTDGDAAGVADIYDTGSADGIQLGTAAGCDVGTPCGICVG